jgi:hypothetical protein
MLAGGKDHVAKNSSAKKSLPPATGTADVAVGKGNSHRRQITVCVPFAEQSAKVFSLFIYFFGTKILC